MKRRFYPVILLMLLCLGGCERNQEEIRNFDELQNMTLSIGLSEDLDLKEKVYEICPNAKILPQNNITLGVTSVSEGKLDAYIANRAELSKVISDSAVGNVKILEETITSFPCGLGLSELCDIPGFEDTVNDTLEEMIREGTIKEMHDRWFDQKNEQMPLIQMDEDPVYTVNAVTFGESRPFSFFKDGSLTGFDVELLYRVCERNHWGVNLTSAQYSSMLLGLSTGKYDMISANLYITEARAENIRYSIPFLSEEICIAVRGKEEAGQGQLEYSSIADLSEAKSFAICSGTIFDSVAQEYYPGAEISYYPSPVDCTLAVASGKADAVIFDAPVLKYIAACTDGVGLIPEYLVKDNYHFILPKTDRGEMLRKEFNEWLSEKKESGEVARMYDYWCSDAEPETVFDFESLPDTNGVIRIGTDAASRPDVYYAGSSLLGFPTELIYQFCRDRGYRGEISIVKDAVMALTAGKEDMAVYFVSYTEERARSVLYTDPVVESGIGVLVRAAENEEDDSLIEDFRDGFEKTFLREDRWQLIVSGLLTAILITLGGFLLANLVGGLFCSCMLSGRKSLRVFADIFDRIMQGTPIVVVLMILYYVIFGKSSISGVWVSILAFGLNTGASLAQQFYGAVTGVDKGQTEAALAIGFTKLQAFTGIVFPQAARSALPGYFSQLISLMKGTSIVGYISVIDLTKAGDLIRSSTYDAFFPLLSVALIYFLISFGLLSLLKRIQKKLAPKRVSDRKEAEK